MSQEESSKNVTTDEEKRLGNDRSQRPSAFMVALENMKGFTQKASVIDMREQDKYPKWFHVSSARNNALGYTVDIRGELRYPC